MNNQFTFDFNNYLKTIQASNVRYIVIGVITLAFMMFMEYGFYVNFINVNITQCSLANQGPSNSSLDNCFVDQVPECLFEEFHTQSKYSLNFPVSLFGLKGDKYSVVILALSLVCFILEIGLYLLLDYNLFLKKKRIQNTMANSMIFIDGKKKHENGFTIFLLVDLAVYTVLKFVWVYWRNHQYSEFVCDGGVIHLTFGQNITSSISTIVLLVVTYVFFPLMYFFAYYNLLSDMDFKNMMSHLSYQTVKQFKYITVLDVSKYQDIIDDFIQDKYSDESFISRFLRSHTFTFSKTTDQEICEILLAHKEKSPYDFEPMLCNEPKISINDNGRDDGAYKSIDNNNDSDSDKDNDAYRNTEKEKLIK
ncbi:hypothetical protein DICPUDRAFT_86244 [Dictyostelium purpureum]|uniref:Uncharacterized protein n=1 Tax=Dictyostelium purpureum TaxID=5786 RepID=F0ZAH3_DICPU|nr:uncharacterized protein DICPUDRAFT_86244 [Dictyostelium purpureum]EGC39071.1 hypothetical protein DICPUDRAFT_86244 [Dictyostelium purpureum]|eukprot:XP_003284421.1 hypothetical protein DICPUDRAFT_86244 [Dictyostelium purpureum]